MNSFAPRLYHSLNGLFCIYKPEGVHIRQAVHSIRTNLAQGLNALQYHPQRQRVIYNEGNLGSDLPVATTIPDLADSTLVLGPPYDTEDFQLYFVDKLMKAGSGVQVMAVGKSGKTQLSKLSAQKYIRVYHITGQLGKASHNFMPDGTLIEKSTYRHVTHERIDKVIAGIQAGHQKHMFVASGVNMQSQEAYDLAAKGLLRPNKDEQRGPVVYGLKCTEFKPPHFTLEVHAIGEGDGTYFAMLVHEVGLLLKTSAVCTQVHRIRYGPYTLSQSVLRKYWQPQTIADNINLCASHTENIFVTPSSNITHLKKDPTMTILENMQYKLFLA